MSEVSVGIVGLPNAGKSTLFNALVSRRLSQTASYPFTTIEPHEAVVPVPDPILEKLSALVKPEKTTPASVAFIDIAGLVKGAAAGEGLGNQFLAKIREVDALIHVVRAFESAEVPQAGKDPKEDIEIVNLELELGGISGKPTLYVLNISEKQLGGSVSLANSLKAATGTAPVLVVAAKLEEELIDMTSSERQVYLQELGVKESGLELLIEQAYQLLNLITFYTIKGGKEVRAWALRRGETALAASSKVHTDFAKHFIKAEVIPVNELVTIGSWNKAKEYGKVRLEGREYEMRDGDVVDFKVGV